MGFRVSWFAVKGLSKEAVVEAMKLPDSGVECLPFDAPVSAGVWPSGWIIVAWNRFDGLDHDLLARLSQDDAVVAVALSETVMASQAFGYAEGVKRWTIDHYSDRTQSQYDLILDGELPAEAPAIIASLKKQQDDEGGEDAEVDFIFDVPVEVAKALTGYRHDEVEPEGVVFTALSRPAVQRAPKEPGKGFFARLFGKT